MQKTTLMKQKNWVVMQLNFEHINQREEFLNEVRSAKYAEEVTWSSREYISNKFKRLEMSKKDHRENI